MHTFLSQRLSIWKSALTLVFILLSAQLGLSAQSSPSLSSGTWLVNTPDDGSLILIIKRNGRASYFWAENADRTVYQGTWSEADSTATIKWADGSQHRLKRDPLGVAIAYDDRQGNERYSVPVQQVPSEILGQWAKPPAKSEALASDRDKAKGFFGIWRIGETGNHYVFVEADRSAASTWSPDSSSNRGLRGSWAKQGSELHIIWDSGHYSILREGERGFAYKRIQPGTVIEDDVTEFTAAARTSDDNVSSNWFGQYEEEKANYAGGIAFTSRKNARQFYRGPWLVKHSDTAFEQIEIGRFGGLSTTRDRSLKGNWLMNGQDIFMRWDDGMRKILSPIGQGFVLYTYKPGRPLDGVPTTVLAAAPADTSKLTAHLKGREAVAQQMLNLAEAAGIDPDAQQTGWGQTFMRWAWPFGGEQATTASSQALLQNGFEESAGANDPWWWPLWSEKPTLPTETEDSPVETSEAEAVSTTEAIEPTTSEVALDSNAPEPTKEATEPSAESNDKKSLRKEKDAWYWPF